MTTQILPQGVPVPVSVLPADKDDTVFAGTEGDYFLPHNSVEIERLQRQHQHIKLATDGKLVPDLLPAGAAVLDSGCADGTWLLDLQSQQPRTLDLHGVDLSPALFRTHPSLSLRTHDIRTPFSASFGFADRFDLVHQRLLVWGIQAEDWPAAIHHLSAALKPGVGVLQLVEAEWILNEGAPANCPEQRKLNLVQDWATAGSGMDVRVWDKLEGLMKEEGLVDVELRSFDFGYGKTAKGGEEVQRRSAELWVESFRHVARKIVDGEGIPGVAKTAEEYHEFLDRLMVEMKTYGYTPRLKWVRGRKPLA